MFAALQSLEIWNSVVACGSAGTLEVVSARRLLQRFLHIPQKSEDPS